MRVVAGRRGTDHDAEGEVRQVVRQVAQDGEAAHAHAEADGRPLHGSTPTSVDAGASDQMCERHASTCKVQTNRHPAVVA
jgi:hypothetical protein